MINYLVGGLEPWNFMTFHHIGNNNPNWRTHVFREVETTNQMNLCPYLYHWHPLELWMSMSIYELKWTNMNMFPKEEIKRRIAWTSTTCWPWLHIITRWLISHIFKFKSNIDPLRFSTNLAPDLWASYCSSPYWICHQIYSWILYAFFSTSTFWHALFLISTLFNPSMLYLRWSPSRTSCRGQTYCQRSAPWKATKWRSHGRTEPKTCGRVYVTWRARSARSIPIRHDPTYPGWSQFF